MLEGRAKGREFLIGVGSVEYVVVDIVVGIAGVLGLEREGEPGSGVQPLSEHF